MERQTDMSADLNYTDEEIRMLYRDAKHKGQMINTILPQLTGRSRREIKQLVQDIKIDGRCAAKRDHILKCEHDEIKELIDKGAGINEIAEEMNCTPRAVKKCINSITERGIMREKRKFTRITDEMTEQIIKAWQSGKSARTVAEEFNIAQSAVNRRIKAAKENGITRNAESATPKKETKRMKQEKTYYCGLCGSRYPEPKLAANCEKSHQDLSDWEATQRYLDSLTPYPISIMYTNGKIIIEYERKNIRMISRHEEDTY